MQIDAFTGDYAAAHSRAVALDQKILSAAVEISPQYPDLVSLATRQTMSALDFTVGTDSNGNIISDDVKIFMKNLGMNSFVFSFYAYHLLVNDDSRRYFWFIAA